MNRVQLATGRTVEVVNSLGHFLEVLGLGLGLVLLEDVLAVPTDHRSLANVLVPNNDNLSSLPGFQTGVRSFCLGFGGVAVRVEEAF